MPAVVDQMHTAGLGVSVWTVDRKRQMKRVLRAGVDAVITNQAGRLVSVLARAGTAGVGDAGAGEAGAKAGAGEAGEAGGR